MHAPPLHHPAARHPSRLPGLLKLLVAAQVAVIVGGILLLAGPLNGGSNAGGPIGSPVGPSSSPATPSPSPSLPSGTPEPSHTPSADPSDSPTPDPTRPPMPVPTETPRVVDPTPPPPPTSGGPPTCAYLDVLTPHRRYADWSRTLLDTIYRLPSTYAPGDLVDTSAAGLNRGYLVRGLVVDDLREMAVAARAAGAPIQVVSGYRSYAKQQATFQHWVDVGGYEQALRTSARAGHSEHQLGTALDVTSQGGLAPWDYRDWATTPAGAWIARHSWRYGFIVSYPRGAFDETCYSYEPWHLRYFGRERAKAIHDSGLTAREFLWTLR
jgi:D-alanyl-D-alanine carboxypeptidase